MNRTLANHTDVITDKVEQFVSSTCAHDYWRADCPLPPLRPASPTPPPECNYNLVSCAPGVHRTFTRGEPTALRSRAVTRG